VFLSGRADVITNQSPDGSTFQFSQQDVEGIDATLTGCEITSHLVAGMWLEGLPAARMADSAVLENMIGILMDTSAQLDIQDCTLAGNDGYGLMFSAMEDGMWSEDCVPEPGRLTGFGNVILEPWEKNGNGVGAFSAGAFPCLLLPEGCQQGED
jgi:hypothetical protein